MSDGDAELVARARAGCRRAFDLLVERHAPAARRAAAGMVPGEELAGDLAQEAMLHAYLSLPRLREDGQFRSWLLGITRNVCRNYLRSRRPGFLSLEALPEGLRFDPGGAGWAGDPHAGVEAGELRRLVLGAIDALPPGAREALRLFYYEQLSVGEIAARLGASEGAVRVRLHGARSSLRRLLAPHCGEPAAPALGPAPPRGTRRKIMRQVTLQDVVQSQKTGQCVALLREVEGDRVLPVWIGAAEAVAIATELARFPVDRPLTSHFMATLLQAAGGELEEARIVSLRDNTFIAAARIRSAGQVTDVDARPSDVLALACRLGRPVSVAEEILDRLAFRDGERPARERLGEDFVSLVEAYRV